MLELEIDNGKYKLRYDGDQLTYTTARCITFVCKEGKDLILALMRENISMKAKFAEIMRVSNEANKTKTGAHKIPDLRSS